MPTRGRSGGGLRGSLRSETACSPLAIPEAGAWGLSAAPGCPAFQGVLPDMPLFTVVGFCVAIPTSILWWRQAHSGVPGVSPVGPRAPGSGGRTGRGHGTVAGGTGQAWVPQRERQLLGGQDSERAGVQRWVGAADEDLVGLDGSCATHGLAEGKRRRRRLGDLPDA